MIKAKTYVVEEISTQEHIEACVQFAHLYCKELPNHELVSNNKVRVSCAQCIADVSRNHVNAWLAYKRGQPIGIALGQCDEPWHNHSKFAVMYVWYVIPSERGSRASLMLVKAFEQWAYLSGAQKLFTGVSSNLSTEQTETTANLLVKLGYPLIGTQHLKELIQ